MYEQPPLRCLCSCHHGSSPFGIAERFRADGVDTLDVIEAAVACRRCAWMHIVPFIDKHVPPPQADGEDEG